MKIISTLLILVSLVGCSELNPSHGRFVIKEAVSVKKGISKYWATPTKGWGNMFFYDSAHMYNVGDTIKFTKAK